jgi:uncharacterized protein
MSKQYDDAYARAMECRPRCGACCVAPSITSAIPGMPHGKPAGLRCVQLDEEDRCRLFGRPERPAVCVGLRPDAAMCGATREHALRFLGDLERRTAPGNEAARAGPPSGRRRRAAH